MKTINFCLLLIGMSKFMLACSDVPDSQSADKYGNSTPKYGVSQGGEVTASVDAGVCSVFCWSNGSKISYCVCEETGAVVYMSPETAAIEAMKK